MSRILPVIAITAIVFLGACGTSRTDRALSGAAIGAGSGAVLGAVSGNVVAGTLIGGAAGAAAGGLTDANDFDLGRPIWRR